MKSVLRKVSGSTPLVPESFGMALEELAFCALVDFAAT